MKVWMRSKWFGIGVVLVLLLLARSPIWYEHSQVDIWIMWQRIEYWLSHSGTFAGMTGNEILPATMAFLFAPLLFIPEGWASYTNYWPVMMAINMAALIGHGYLAKQQAKYWVILLLFGPLLLFRFDAWVTLLVLLAITTFEKQMFGWAGWWLGLAIGMKVFPVILLPYLVGLLVSERKWSGLWQMGLAMAGALIAPVAGFFWLGGNWQQVTASLAFHSQKLISIESVPGSLLIGWSLLTRGVPPEMIPGNGIWAVPGPAELFNRLWVVPVGIFYLLVLRDVGKGQKFSWKVPLSIILIFLVASKNLNPQYLWWFVALLPMTKLPKSIWRWSAAAVVTNQLIFPVYYSVFVDNFFQTNQDYWIYCVLLIRNLSIVMVAYLSLRSWWRERLK